MKTALDIVSEACRTYGVAAPAKFSDVGNDVCRKMVAALNRTAEDLSMSFNWLAQTKLKTFTLSQSAPFYNTTIGGYDLDVLTDGAFDSFTASFMFNVKDKTKIPAIPIDTYIEKGQGITTPSKLSYFRIGTYIVFVPNIKNIDVQFFYQTKNIAKTAKSVDIDIITSETDVPFHNPKLLLRGILVQYAKASGFDTEDYIKDYDKYRMKCEIVESPRTIIGWLSDYGRSGLGRFPDND
jgi:hypothetical protein